MPFAVLWSSDRRFFEKTQLAAEKQLQKKIAEKNVEKRSQKKAAEKRNRLLPEEKGRRRFLSKCTQTGSSYCSGAISTMHGEYFTTYAVTEPMA